MELAYSVYTREISDLRFCTNLNSLISSRSVLKNICLIFHWKWSRARSVSSHKFTSLCLSVCLSSCFPTFQCIKLLWNPNLRWRYHICLLGKRFSICQCIRSFCNLNLTLRYHKLQRSGLSGSKIEWIQNYLSNRLQYTAIGRRKSEQQLVKYGVQQGAVLGPLLFALFCDDLPDCAEYDSESVEMYADDTTLYCICDTVDRVAIL